MSRFFFLLVCSLLFSFSASAYNSDVYFVSGVSVSTVDKSSAAAKAISHATARRDALLILLGRLEMNANIADNVSDEEIADMVRSEQIENESIAGKRYSATFNIMFAEDFVAHILDQKKLIPTSASALKKTYLLIPARMKKNQTLLWGEDNDWKKAVEKTLKNKSLKNFIIPDADIANVATLDAGDITSLDYLALEPVLSRYKADIAYTLIFSYDEIENKVLIEVLRVDKLYKKQFKLSFINVDRLGYKILMNRVSDKTIQYLVNSQIALPRNTSPNSVLIKVYIDSLEDWLRIKNKIERSNLVNQLNIELISRERVVATLNYIGSGEIQKSFADHGIRMNRQSDNSFTIDAN